VPYLSASAVVILHEDALYQVYTPLPFYLLQVEYLKTVRFRDKVTTEH